MLREEQDDGTSIRLTVGKGIGQGYGTSLYGFYSQAESVDASFGRINKTVAFPSGSRRTYLVGLFSLGDTDRFRVATMGYWGFGASPKEITVTIAGKGTGTTQIAGDYSVRFWDLFGISRFTEEDIGKTFKVTFSPAPILSDL